MGEAKRKTSKRTKTLPALYQRARVVRFLAPDLTADEIRTVSTLHALAEIHIARPSGEVDSHLPENRPQHYLRQELWTAADRNLTPIAQGETLEEVALKAGVEDVKTIDDLSIVDGLPGAVTDRDSLTRRIWICPEERIFVDDDAVTATRISDELEGTVRTCPSSGTHTSMDFALSGQVLAAALIGTDSAHFAHARMFADMMSDPIGPYSASFGTHANWHADAHVASRFSAEAAAMGSAATLEDLLDRAEATEEHYVEMHEGAWQAKKKRLFIRIAKGVSPLQIRPFDRSGIRREPAESAFEWEISNMSRESPRQIRPFSIPDKVGRLAMFDEFCGNARVSSMLASLRADALYYGLQTHETTAASGEPLVYAHCMLGNIHAAFRATPSDVLAYFWQE